MSAPTTLKDPILSPSPDDFAKFMDEADAPRPVQNPPTTWYGRLWNACCRPSETCKKVIGAVFWGGTFVASTALRGIKLTSFKAQPVATTVASLVSGMSLHGLLSKMPSQNFVKGMSQFSMDQALTIWFALTNLYLYYNEEDSVRKEALLTALTAHVGFETALAFTSLFKLNMTDMPWQHVALVESQMKDSESVEEAPPTTAPLFLEPQDPMKYVLSHGLIRVAAGISSIALFGNHSFGNPLGTYLIADAVGIAVAEAFQNAKSIQIKDARLRILGTAAFIFLEGGWGMIISLFEKDLAAFAFMGIATGITKPFYKRKFEKVAPDALSNARFPAVEKLNLFTKAAFTVGFGLWLGNNFYIATDLGERVALIVCATTLPITVIAKEILNRRFKWGTHHPIINSLKFYTEDYTVPSAVIVTFIEQFNGFGSKVLKEGDLVKSFIIPSIGWTAYMVALGGSMATVQPRMPLAFNGLSNNYVGWLMQGKG